MCFRKIISAAAPEMDRGAQSRKEERKVSNDKVTGMATRDKHEKARIGAVSLNGDGQI